MKMLNTKILVRKIISLFIHVLSALAFFHAAAILAQDYSSGPTTNPNPGPSPTVSPTNCP